jgi:hypothetical protein
MTNWIKCSEEMPDCDKPYLVSVRPIDSPPYVTIGYWPLSPYAQWEGVAGDDLEGPVVAFMKLPPPYEGEE